MKAFEFDQNLIDSYSDFSRSFSKIRADDLKEGIERKYQEGHFWPDALVSLNPLYEKGPSAEELVASGDICAETCQVFQLGGKPIRFHRHQGQAIAKACGNQSFVVTTGTGSGKSLCFFVPIVDAIIRSRKAGEGNGTRAIIIYPMNALANSQLNEINKFIEKSGVSSNLRPVVRRYTGQERNEERERIASNPPDILLTNFMMAELLLTRQNPIDSRVIANAKDLQFIVLDELHTYRGRQGADVAVLVRRLRDRCARDKAPICIGTSATMASEGSDSDRARAVARVASRLFGTPVGPDAVIDESLRRATANHLTVDDVKDQLPAIVAGDLPRRLSDSDLREHALAVWVELAVGLDDGQILKRRPPMSVARAAEALASVSGAAPDRCQTVLEQFLTQVSLPETERGGSGENAFLAFKLHRFVAGAGDVFVTLQSRPRTVLLDGQLEDPSAPGTRLYPVRFCRECGQEYYVVNRVATADGFCLLPRSIDETPNNDENDAEVAGYLTPDGVGEFALRFDGSIDTVPEDWTEVSRGVTRIRSHRRRHIPEELRVARDGSVSDSGEAFWFIPGKFRFCLACIDAPHAATRERTKLAGLTSEGRSSASTLFVSSALQWLNRPESEVPDDKRKLLGFIDNRQDAALQAGHFNDFVFVTLLRGAMLQAVLRAGEHGLADEEFGYRVQRALGFTDSNKDLRRHWMLNPDNGPVIRSDAERALAKVLSYRIWSDLRRGWRFTNPSLADLRLIEPHFVGLDDIAGDQQRLERVLPALGTLDRTGRKSVIGKVLKFMLEGLAVGTEALDPAILDMVGQKSRTLLRSPWGIDGQEALRPHTKLCLTAPGKREVSLGEERLILRAGPRSRLGRSLNRREVISQKLSQEEYLAFLQRLLNVLGEDGLISPVSGDRNLQGWRLSPSAVRLVGGDAALSEHAHGNTYFHGLYTRIGDELGASVCSLFGMESREHTAQVTVRQREWREWRFRYEQDDRQRLAESEAQITASGESGNLLPALFCTPTMELGVDISALNAVYLRNVPPTPASYAQRAGRSGRSGQSAAILTYCAAQSPHDQYYFERRIEMVAGAVRPPALDITNESLVTSHLHAVWLAETGLDLAPKIPDILDLNQEAYPLQGAVAEAVTKPGLTERAQESMSRILYQILDSLESGIPAWMDDPEQFVATVAEGAPEQFDRAFERWRQLYGAAHTQLSEANQESERPGLSDKERRRVRARQAQASDQIEILEQGRETGGSDFYSYRYLATEGFLPGYNFPRLPLYAFIPGSRGPSLSKHGTYLQRARFLAISEFGPRSLIYHEGRAFRVVRAKLPPEVRTRDGQELSTRDLVICPNCGASHSDEVERCHGCASSMSNAVRVKRTLRIDNVEAVPAERITVNDEERVRMGFDIQTVFAWPVKHGHGGLDVSEAVFRVDDTSIITLQYANSARISRINKGLKRRSNRNVLGFVIDPRTGYWAKSEDEDPESDAPPDEAARVRIVPIVEDRKNALLLRFETPGRYHPKTIATVQHALVRGLTVVFQLEEGEILAEPLPDRDKRRAILAYEATEGGAGVLSRLIEDPEALRRVARQALVLMHLDGVAEAVRDGSTDHLRDLPDAPCVRGCYRCLLSYYNQPDHENIDRTSEQVRQLLVDLARGDVVPTKVSAENGAAAGWRDIIAEHGLPLPDAEPLTLGGTSFPFTWHRHYVAAMVGSIPDVARTEAEDRGWMLYELTDGGSDGVPAELIDALRE